MADNTPRRRGRGRGRGTQQLSLVGLSRDTGIGTTAHPDPEPTSNAEKIQDALPTAINSQFENPVIGTSSQSEDSILSQEGTQFQLETSNFAEMVSKEDTSFPVFPPTINDGNPEMLAKNQQSTGGDIKVHLKRLPPTASEDILTCYFESQGENIEVTSVILLGDGEADVSLSGLTADEYAILMKKTHKLSKSKFDVEVAKSKKSLSCTIEVTGSTKAIKKDILEMYFESKKSGGSEDSIDTCSIISDEIANIAFKTSEIATRVVLKESHVVCGCRLQVKLLEPPSESKELPNEQYDLSKLKISMHNNIPPDHLSLLISTLFDIEEDNFKVEIHDNSALISFDTSFTLNQLQEMCSKIREKKLKSGTLDAELVKMCSSILVHNIDNSDRYDEDFITLYFNSSKKSGGGGVEKVCLLGSGKAMVTFEDPKVSERILKKNHQYLGDNVTVELYTGSDFTSVEVLPMQGSPSSQNYFELVPGDIDRMIITYIHKRPECLAELSKEQNLMVKPNAESSDSIVVTSLVPTVSGWMENCKQLVIERILELFTVITDIQVEEHSLGEINDYVCELRDKNIFDFRFTNKSKLLHVVGSREVLTQFQSTIKEIMNKYIKTEVMLNLTGPEYNYVTQANLDQLKEHFPNVVIVPDGEVPGLKVSGTVCDLDVLEKHLAKTKIHASVNVALPASVLHYLYTDGRSHLNKYMKEKAPDIVVSFLPDEHNTINLNLLCKSSDNNEAKHVASKLKAKTTEHQIPLSKSFLSVMDELEDFKPMCDSLQSGKRVKIFPQKEIILITGFKKDVKHCSRVLDEYVAEKSKVQQNKKIDKGEWKLLETYMNKKWQMFTEKFKSLNIEICTHLPNSDHPSIVLVGDRINIKSAMQNLQEMLSTVAKKIIPVKRSGTCEFFTSPKGRIYLDGIEKQTHVSIEVSIAGSEDDTQGAGYETVSSMKNCRRKCVGYISHMKVLVCSGDITEYQAEVMVNAANERLSHDGGVALAISKKGGPVIQEECTQHVRKQGTIDVGDVWCTPKTGGLPCKLLVHAVGPIWKGGYRKEETLLYKATISSLEKAHNYHSIVLPAISSGIYGFPVQKCANRMVQAVTDFAKKYPVCPLQEVTFISLPSQDKTSSAFVSALQKVLEPDKVQIDPDSPSIMPSSTPKGKETRQAVSPIERHTSGKTSTIGKSVLDKVCVCQGSLLDVQVDIYVNTTNPQLQLTQGAVSLALLKVGGQLLQQECNNKAPINVGDVAITGPGNLRCRHVLHTVLPGYKKRSVEAEKILQKSVKKCMQICGDKGVKSIAFPSLGTGNLGFPNAVVARVMLKEIFKYLSDHKKTSISEVNLVIYMKDTLESFRRELKSYGPKEASKEVKKRRSIYVETNSATKNDDQSQTKSFVIKAVTVNISHGDITESKCDVIVNPTDSRITLTGQGVAGAILRKGGDELKQLCDVLTSNGKILDDSTPVIETKATGSLKAKYLFHICFDGNDQKNFHKIIMACLEKAEKERHSSIAFPAIGTGVHGYPEEQAAMGMLKVISQFTLKYPASLLIIDIVLYQPSTFEKFIQAFQNPAYSESGIFQRAKNFILKPFGYGESTESDVIPLSKPVQQDELDIKVYGLSKEAVLKAEKLFFDLLDEFFTTESIFDPMINDLSEEDKQILKRESHLKNVEMIFDYHPVDQIRLKGDIAKVHEMKNIVRDKLSKMEQMESRRREAKQLSQTIQWKRMDSQESEYDELTNYEIECEYQKDKSGQYVHGKKDGPTHFRVNFKEMAEFDISDGTKYKVVRVDIVEQLKKGDVPNYWDDIPKGVSMHVVDLKSDSKEYKDVLKEFDRTMANGYRSIKTIQRIQNPVLYAQYIAKKKEMDKFNPPGYKNELFLFHGTSADTCPKINQQGFNRSFSGKNAVVYGNGVYFARNASYSSRTTYSPPDANGYKYVYYARVLTGEYTTGRQGLIVPPPKDPANQAVLYDSVVDNVQNPSVYVIFFDSSNYPEYLIVFN